MTRLPMPDPDFELPREDRARLRTDIDAGALERLLAHLPPDFRSQVLRAFFQADDVARDFLSDAEPPIASWRQLSSDHPVLQQLLDEVYAPMRQAQQRALERAAGFERTERPLLEAPVLVGIVPRLPRPGLIALVVRRASGLPHDLIAIAEQHATPRSLDAALRRLLSERRAAGLKPEQDLEIAITEVDRMLELPGTWEGRLRGILEGVSASPRDSLGSLGVGRWMECRLL